MPKILVADDSITVRKVAERLLTEAGMEVALAASGEEAMAYLSTERPDFVISDVIMPDKTGYDVCRFVRSQQALASTPVLLISGIVNDEVNRQAESCRANGVLKKPFQGTSLQERVRELLALQGQAGPATAESMPNAVEMEPALQISASAPVPSITESPASASTEDHVARKAYRITEEQLDSFRRSSERIQELEQMLEQEKSRPRDSGPPQSELSAPRIRELEAALAEAQRQLTDLAAVSSTVEDLKRRNQELESAMATMRASSTSGAVTGPAPFPAVAELQALLTEQQRRFSELADQVIHHAEAGDRVRSLEAALAEEQARTAELRQRCDVLEQSLAEARHRSGELLERLAQIGRLVSTPVGTDATGHE